MPLERPVMEDLIQNAHTLFDGRPSPSQSPPAPLSDVVEATSTETHDPWFLSPDSKLPQSAEIKGMGSTSRHRSGLVDSILASTEPSFSLLPPDGDVVNHLPPPRTGFLSPLRGLWSTKRPAKGVETKTQERLRVTERGTKAKSPVPHSEARTIPQRPPKSIASTASYFARSSATSLRTTM